MKKISSLLIVLGLAMIAYPFFENILMNHHNQQLIESIENSSQTTKQTTEVADTIIEADSSVGWRHLFDDQKKAVQGNLTLAHFMGVVGEDDIANSALPQNNQLLIVYKAPSFEVAADGLTYIGTLNVPSIGLDMPVVDGTTDVDIAISAGHMLGTAYPGQIGNSVIVGHRGYSYGRLFNRLDELTKGDQIAVTYNGQTYQYTVYQSKVVLPTDTSVTNQTNKAKVLTLITCTPLYSSDYRLVIHAVLNDN